MLSSSSYWTSSAIADSPRDHFRVGRVIRVDAPLHMMCKVETVMLSPGIMYTASCEACAVHRIGLAHVEHH